MCNRKNKDQKLTKKLLDVIFFQKYFVEWEKSSTFARWIVRERNLGIIQVRFLLIN